MINIVFAPYSFKFDNQMLTESFNYYFTKPEVVHKTRNTQQKRGNKFDHFYTSFESGRKSPHHSCLKVLENIPKEFYRCLFLNLNISIKIDAISKYLLQQLQKRVKLLYITQNLA